MDLREISAIHVEYFSGMIDKKKFLWINIKSHPFHQFRRSVSQNLKRICKTGLLKCSIEANARVGCKLCRFNKCIEVGMKPEQVDKTKKAIIAYFAEQEFRKK